MSRFHFLKDSFLLKKSYFLFNSGNPDIVRLLLEHGAIARPHYYTKYSPLYIACHMGNIEIAKMILEVN